MKKLIIFIFTIFNNNWSNDKIYNFTKDPIDVVITCHEKDIKTLDLSIKFIKYYGKNIRNVYVLSEKKFTNKAIWFDENKFPFNKYKIALEIHNGNTQKADEYSKSARCGWIFKQIMNLYSPLIIPNISPNVLILDADTLFINKVEFMDEQNCPLFDVGDEYHEPYFSHCSKLISNNFIKKVFPNFSGITHHMIFQKPVIEDLFELIEKTHNIEPWKVYCKCIDHNHLYASPTAETEIYFNFIFSRSKQAKLRPLKWMNLNYDLKKIPKLQNEGIHHISFHEYINEDFIEYKNCKN